MIITPTERAGQGTHGLEPAHRDSAAEKAKEIGKGTGSEEKYPVHNQPEPAKAGEISEEEAREFYGRALNLLSAPKEGTNLGHSGLDANRVAALLDL